MNSHAFRDHSEEDCHTAQESREHYIHMKSEMALHDHHCQGRKNNAGEATSHRAVKTQTELKAENPELANKWREGQKSWLARKHREGN